MAEEPFSAACGPLSEGTLLGKYRINGFTAFSSTGEVYSVTEEKSNRRCSLVVISAAISGHSPDVAARLLKKAEKACFFRHKTFVSIQETFRSGDFRCIVTELIQGKNLRVLLEEQSLLPAESKKIAKELAELLVAAEKFPEPAFEFNPDDVFITASGKVKYLYPGSVTQIHLFSGATFLQGPRLRRNILFAAPELLLGNVQNSFAASVYSLGVLYNFMLSAGKCFPSENECVPLAELLQGKHTSPASAENAHILRSMLEADPARRVNSAGSLLKLIGVRSSLPKATFRNCTVILLLCVIFGALIFFYQKREPSDKDKTNFGKPPVPSPARQVPIAKGEKPLPESTPAAPAKAPVKMPRRHAPVPLHLAVQKLTPPEPPRRGQTPEERIEYSRRRLQQLESDLARGVVDPRLMKLHQERIKFRKKQIMVLNGIRNRLRKEKSSKQDDTALNQKIHREVLNYLAPYKSRHKFTSLRFAISRGRKVPFPSADLRKPGVDFNMRFDLPALLLPGMSFSRNGQKVPITLAFLLLNGYLMPSPEAVILLADSGRILKDLPMQSINYAISGKDLSEEHVRLLVRQNQSPYNTNLIISLLLRNNRSVAKTVVEEELFKNDVHFPNLLHLFASKGFAEGISLLLAADVPLEHKNISGETALFAAYKEGYPECVKILLDAGAFPGHINSSGKKAQEYETLGDLASAVRNNDLVKAERAISRGADVNAFLFGGTTPLIIACRLYNKEMAELLIKRGADVNKCSQSKRYPLSETFLLHGKGSPELFELLLNKGADPALYPSNQKYLLRALCHNSFAAGRPEAPRFAEIMLKSGKFQAEPQLLFHVCRPYSRNLFKALIEHWQDFSSPEYANLFLTALERRMPADVIKLMIQRKLPTPSPTLLKRALERRNDPEISALFPLVKNQPQLRPQPFQPVRFGVSSPNAELAEKAYKAIKRQRQGELERAVEEGVSPDTIVKGMTLLQHAAEGGAFLAAEFLLKKNADPFKVSFTNRNFPTVLAVRNNSLRVFDLLAARVPRSVQVHHQVMLAILERNNAYDYLRTYVKHHRQTLKNMPACYLTTALRYQASDKVLVLLINLYREFSHPRHKAVIHQALTSEYSLAVIKALLDRKAQVMLPARSYYKVDGRWYSQDLTPLQTANRARSPYNVIRLLKKRGAK